MNKISFYKRSYLSFLGLLSTTILEILASSRYPVFAQSNIIPDDTLGSESSIVVPIDSGGLPIDAIRGGATRGSNLFHSFKEFNVGEGRSSYFLNNDNNLQNILTRVTGNNPSNILGTLGILKPTGITSNPNLYLINPNGIVFGENASLDVGGSFVATTADAIEFGEQGFFSATNLETPQLLTVAPGALFFQQVRSQPGNIINRGNLAVGKDFTVAADNLDLQGQLLAGEDLKLQANNAVKVRDSVTNPFIAAAKGELLVQGNQSVDIFALSHADSGFFSGGDMVLRSANQVGGDAKYWSGGSFRIEQLDGSLGDLFSPYDPVIRSLGDVSFNNYGGNSLHIFAAGSVTVPGSIFITNPETGVSGENFIAENITLSNGTVLPIDGSLKPTLDIRAGVDSTQVGVPKIPANDFYNNLFFSFINLSGSPSLLPENPVSSNTAINGDIKINDINMLAADGTVFLTNNYKPNTAISGGNIEVGRISTNDGNGQFLGNSGSIIFDGRSNITLTDRVNTGSASGNSGDITLLADGDISLKDNAVLVANTRGAGSGGNIFIQANGLVSLSNSKIITNVTSDATGKGGDITVNANSVSLIDKALIDASTFGRGNAGQIFINADGAVSLESNSSILNNIEEEKAVGNAAGINIQAKTVTLSRNSQITSLVDGEGKAGNITIKADDSVVLSGNNSLLNSVITTRIASNTGPNRDGKTGDITIQTGSLDLNGAVITNSTFGNGNTGKISIEADKDILLSNNAAIFSSISAGNSGVFANSDDITIDAKSLTLDSSSIQTVIRDASGEFNPVKGKSGNININLSGDLKITGDNADVFQGIITSVADGAEGKAGDIRITARDFSLAATNAQVRSTLDSFAIGEGGNIDVKVRNLNLTQASRIFSFTAGKGDAGNISIEVTDNIILNDSSVISSGVVQGGNGNGGNISLKAGSLSFTNGSQLQSTVGIPLGGEGTENLEPAQGNAGNIDINISNKAVLDGINSNHRVSSGINSAIFSEVGGKGGDIKIQTPFLHLNNRGVITAASSGEGNAGNINISVDNLLNMRTGNIFTTSIKSSGGNIDVKAQDIRLFDNSDIRTNVFNGTGGGGNINLTANTIVAVDDSDILSFARDGKGGDITFNTEGFFSTPLYRPSSPTANATTLEALDNNSRVDVNASGTVNGAVTGVPDVTFIDDELTDLPDSQIDTNALIANSCISRGTKRQENSFIITGSGALRNSPGDGFVSTYSTGDVRNISENNQSSEWKKGEPIIEPQGVYKLASGELILSRECR